MILVFITLLSHAIAVTSLSCAHGETAVECVASPCAVHNDPECINYPTAKCMDYLCDGCNMRWSSDGKTIYTAEDCGLCPDFSAPVLCVVSPCADTTTNRLGFTGTDKTCSFDATLQCVDDYCGGCNFYFTDGKSTYTAEECGYGSTDTTTDSPVTTAATTSATEAVGCETCATGLFSNGCNDCYCDEKGEAQCDARLCVWKGIAKCYDCDECPFGYFDGCNNCVCNEKGLAACTEKWCDPWGYPSCNQPETTTTAGTTTKGKDTTSTSAAVDMCDTCSTGLFTNGCQDCYCDEKGEAHCDDKVCVWEGIAHCYDCDECPFGYFDGCNHCVCGENGIAACTKMFCDPWGYPSCDPPETTTTTLTPGEGTTTTSTAPDMCDTCATGLFYDGCNNCYCSGGNAVCDDNICKTQGPSYCIDCDECSGGYYDGCNTCTCTERGAACTEMACIRQEIPHCNEADGTTEKPTTTQKSDETTTTEEPREDACAVTTGGVWSGGRDHLNCKFCVCDEDSNLEECIAVFSDLKTATQLKLAAHLQHKCPDLAECDVNLLDLTDEVYEDLEAGVQPLNCDCDLFTCNPLGPGSTANTLNVLVAFGAAMALFAWM